MVYFNQRGGHININYQILVSRGEKMFEIRYKISNEIKDEISDIDENSFDIEYGDIEGQFELNFNSFRQGYVHEEIPLGRELLVSWYKILNEVAIKLNSNDYVAFSILETDDYWIELICKDNLLKIKKVKDNLNKRNLQELVITKPFKEFTDYKWGQVVIGKTEFIHEVKQKTRMFIKDVISLNNKLFNSKTMQQLILINKEL
jgi:hypothetical protein